MITPQTTRTGSVADINDTAESILTKFAGTEVVLFDRYKNVKITASGDGDILVASKMSSSPAVAAGDYITIPAGTSEVFTAIDLRNSRMKAAVNANTNTVQFIGDPDTTDE